MARYIHKVSGARVQVRDDKVMDSSWRRTDGDATETEGYEAMTVPKLKAEIERRNEGREGDALLSVEGRKPDLIAVLQADDAARTDQ
jgi:hypothetical protein